jgi:hypothetical protein
VKIKGTPESGLSKMLEMEQVPKAPQHRVYCSFIGPVSDIACGQGQVPNIYDA